MSVILLQELSIILVLARTKAGEELARQVLAPEEVGRERANKVRVVVTVTQDHAILEPAMLVCLPLVHNSDKALAITTSPLLL